MNTLELLNQHISELTVAKNAYDELVEQKVNVWKELLTEYIKDLVKDIPNFLRIEWTQYTPYFADGDRCEFGINSTDLYLLEPNEISDNADYHSIDGKYTYEVGKDIRRSIDSMLYANYDLMLAAFDDGSKISYTRGDTDLEVREYDHD